jgi:superfamily II DNA/RNA helicase
MSEGKQQSKKKFIKKK